MIKTFFGHSPRLGGLNEKVLFFQNEQKSLMRYPQMSHVSFLFIPWKLSLRRCFIIQHFLYTHTHTFIVCFFVIQRPVSLEEDRGESSHDLADGHFFPPSFRGKNNTRLIIRLPIGKRCCSSNLGHRNCISRWLFNGFKMMPRWRDSFGFSGERL